MHFDLDSTKRHGEEVRTDCLEHARFPERSGLQAGDSLEQANKEKELRKEKPVSPLSFHEHNKPVIMEGAPGKPALIFFGGLAGTGWPWLHTARELHAEHGNRAEIYSLRGHGEDIGRLPRTSHSDWVDDILQKASAARIATGRAPIVFGYSTSAIAALEAAALEPGLFAALVIVGTPLKLKDTSSRLTLSILDLCSKTLPGARWLLSRIWVKLPDDPPYNDPHGLLGAQPYLASVPLTSVIALYRLQIGALLTLPKVNCPVLSIQGAKDKYTDLSDARRLIDLLASEQKEFVAFTESPHPVMLGEERDSFVERVRKWVAIHIRLIGWKPG